MVLVFPPDLYILYTSELLQIRVHHNSSVWCA